MIDTVWWDRRFRLYFPCLRNFCHRLPGYLAYCTVRDAVAVTVGSTVLVAVTVTVWGDETLAGAVYRPVELIAPGPETDQVTELLIYQPTAYS